MATTATRNGKPVSADAAPVDAAPVEVTPPPLPLERLRWRCDPGALGFDTTDEIPPLAATVGQERGADAIALALGVDAPGYNLYVAGPPGTGRTTTIRQQLARAAAQRPSGRDWCYLHNFAQPSQPVAVTLPGGGGPALARELDDLIVACRREIPRIFESERYEHDRAAVFQRLQEQRDLLFDGLRGGAEQLGFALSLTPTGIVTRPLSSPGHVMSHDAFELLPEEQKADIRARGQQLDRKIDDVLRSVRRLERDAEQRLRTLDREAVVFAVGHLLDELRQRYPEVPAVLAHLDGIQADLIEHLDELRGGRARSGELSALLGQRPTYDQYRANVLVTHPPNGGAPVVFEPNPSYYNLIGRIDYRATMGGMHTDCSLLRAGALHRANGGFLVVEARDVLLNPFSWDALKRAARDGEVRMENLGEQLSAFPTAVLKPQPIPLQVKIVLVGDLSTYLLLFHLDDDFRKLFRVKAQFGPTMERTPAAVQAYAGFVSAQVRERGLLPFGSDAVARVLEHSARLAEDQEELTTAFDTIAEVLVEASFWARQPAAGEASGDANGDTNADANGDAGGAAAARVRAADVDRALAEQERRANLLEERVQRLIRQRTVDIDVRSSVVGQVNGLSIVDLGDYAFAHPARITARTAMGSEGVVNVEREAKLSGPVHSKGVMTLSGYLLGTYAQQQPLAVSARLAFEQVYGEVDGDSASSAELYALLSSLAGVPIQQGIAVTGSVNQQGEVQAVGGVTRKIEGYYAVCAAQGLTGEQGVVIPEANVRHLMLRQEVLDAVAAGAFRIWAVRHVDEGIALLTGVPAGRRQADGTFPEGTIHGRVERRLTAYAARLAQFGRGTDFPPAKEATASSSSDGKVAAAAEGRDRGEYGKLRLGAAREL